MKEDRDFGYNEIEAFELVQRYENFIRQKKSFFFDVMEYEVIINYYLDNEEHTCASDAINRAIAMHPYSSEIQLLKAELYFTEKKYDEALKILNYLEQVHTEKSEVLYLKGHIYFNKGDLIKAEENFKNAVETCAEDRAELNYRISSIYFVEEELNTAIRYLHEAHRIDHKHFATLFDLGYSYEKVNDIDKSYYYYNKLLDLYPFTQNVWYNLGIVLTKQGKFDEAIEAYDYCIAIDPEYNSAYHNKANTLASIERYKEATSVFQELIILEPDNPRVFCSLGECYEKLEKFEQALEMYNKTISIDPAFAEAYYGIGIIMNERKQPNLALDFIKKAIALESEMYDFWLGLGKVYYELNRIEEALTAYREATTLNPDEPDAYLALAEIYLYQEKFRDVEYMFDELGQKFDGNASMKVLNAAALYLSHRRKEALDELKVAKRIDPTSIDDFFSIVSVINDDEFMDQTKQL
ncbi:MAG: tetratricopeptide repeat protein [Bacteroidales bacterium]|nr:MAG: tetratricopeptide repeat protein [Bacteroidales bacterium]